MAISVEKEYCVLTDKKHGLEKELRFLSVGYISKKNIKGHVQYYLQKREGTRVISTYVHSDELENIFAEIERRKEINRELSNINEQLSKLEKAAKIIDNNLYCHLMVYKLCSGMDDLSSEEKEKCSSFGYAMNAVEGVYVSTETNTDIIEWKKGERTYLSLFENTLKRYGFPMES